MLLICLWDVHRRVARAFSPLLPLISFSFFLFRRQLHRCPVLIELSGKGHCYRGHSLLHQWLLRVFRPRIHFGVTLKFENLISVVLSKFPVLFLCQCRCFLFSSFLGNLFGPSQSPEAICSNELRMGVGVKLRVSVSGFLSLALFFGKIT